MKKLNLLELLVELFMCWRCRIKLNVYKGLFNNMIKNFPRQALHAETLQFTHPETKDSVDIKSKLPIDLIELEKL